MSYGQYNPYESSPAQEAGESHPQTQGHGRAQDQYELRDYSPSHQQTSQQTPSKVLDRQAFLDRVKQLRKDAASLESSIDHIGQLHQRTLSGTDGQARNQLEHYVSETQIKTTGIKDGIKVLERDVANTTTKDRDTKNTQLHALKDFFKDKLAAYQSVEQQYHKKYHDQLYRQYSIVYPDATEEEIRQAVESDRGTDGVFQSALKDNRNGHARSLLGNVRARQNELQHIEKTLSELAVMYQELATVVEQQDPVVQAAETNAEQTKEHIEAGNEQVKRATVSARRARKLKWWCFFIVVLIIIAIALGVGLGICLTGNKCK